MPATPHGSSNGHIGWFQASGHTLKWWLWTDNYRICPDACDKSYDEGWLQAWNQAIYPKPVLLRVAELLKTSYMPKTGFRLSLQREPLVYSPSHSRKYPHLLFFALHILESSLLLLLSLHILANIHTCCSWILSLRRLYPATPKVLAIDRFWGKDYNAGSDGAWI